MGYGQLSLLEHALCPLDSRTSLKNNLVHNSCYPLVDAARHTRTARVRVFCPLGLSATDELYLWGLLALTLRQAQPSPEFHATPHYCLVQLGLIDAHGRRGGRQYQDFRNAIERLSVVRYLNDRFYDPIRAEHRQVSFGFFSYSLPADDTSNRAWRFFWDPLFFEFVQPAGGSLSFDLELYRQLDAASRRIFLLASKVFHRRTAVSFDLQHLAVDVMGLSETLICRDQLAKTRRCLKRLAAHLVVRANDAEGIRKLGRGWYAITLEKGQYFDRPRPRAKLQFEMESPLHGVLLEIGLDAQSIQRHLKQFSHTLLREWTDITLAAHERFGAKFFKRSPAAYFVDNVKHAAEGRRTPPDWWHGIRKAEEARRGQRLRNSLADQRFQFSTGAPAASHSGMTPISTVLAQLPLQNS
jgi:hypothetical protein